MKTPVYRNETENYRGNRKRKLKLPNYLIKRKISIMREKIIARKYGVIYLRKVFGKYYPSECARYYKNKLLSKYFSKLKARWFEAKETHRLLLEANIFFRHKLTAKTFTEWRSFSKKLKTVGRQERVARYKHDEYLITSILRNWKRITDLKKNYRIIRSNVTELYHLMYTLMSFLKLAEYYCREIEQNLLEIYSILRGRFFILRKYSRRWKMYLFQQKNSKSLNSKATNYYRSKTVMLYFTRWRKYVFYKRTKHEIVDLCRGLYKDGLLKTVLKSWKYKTKSQITEKKNIFKAVKLHNDLTKRKLIKTWRRYVRHKLRGRSLKHKASFFNAMRLKQKVLSVLSKRVSSRRNKKLATQKLKLFYKRLLLITVWNKWTEIIDERNDYELRNKLSLAKSFYEGNCTRKYLSMWIGYKIFCRREKALKLNATDLCKKFYCQKFLNAWKREYDKKRRVAVLEEKALKFFNHTLMRDSVSRWIESYNRAITMKAKYQKSVLHYQRKLGSKCFSSWIAFCNEQIRAENLIKEATEYYLEILLRKTFSRLSMNVARIKMKQGKMRDAENMYKKNLAIRAFENWREYCLRVKELVKKVEEFEDRRGSKLKREIIVHWRLYVHRKRCSRRKTLTSLTHNRKKTCLRIFERLKNYVNYKKEKRIRLTYLTYGVERIEENMKTMYFQKWRMARLNVLKEKSKIFHADQFHESNLKQKYLFLWQKFLIQHKIKRKHQSDLNNTINYLILNKFFKIWHTRYQALLANHFNEEWAGKIYEMKIGHKYFVAWKYFAEISMTEKKEINNAKELHKNLVIKEGLQHMIKNFLRNTELRFEAHLKNIERNSSRGLELLRKYFNKWRKAVSVETENRLQGIEDRKDIENVIPTKLKINNKKYVSDLIPRFIIPEFMKTEIKLRFGIGQSANKIPIDYKREKIPQRGRISDAKNLFTDQKECKNVPRSQTDDQNREKNRFKLKTKSGNDQKLTSNDLTKPRCSRLNTKIMSPNKTSRILSPDSLKSDSDSARTYVIQNSRHARYLNRRTSSRYSNNSELVNKEHNKENTDYRLLPPAAFYASLNDS